MVQEMGFIPLGLREEMESLLIISVTMALEMGICPRFAIQLQPTPLLD